MIPRYLPRLLMLAMLLPSSLLAQTTAQSPCTAVANTVLTAAPPTGPRGPWFSPVRALDKASNGMVVADIDGWRAETRQAGLDRLRALRASPSLQESIGELTADSWLYSIHRFGNSSLRIAKVVQGTASCQRFVFFDNADLVAAPPIVRTNDETAFCLRRSAYASAVAGVPAFIVQDDRDETVVLSITPWRDGQWQRSCSVVIKFDPVFEVTDRFCQGVDCTAVADQVLAVVKRVDLGDGKATDENELFRTMKKLAEEDPPGNRLPTFGGNIRGAHDEFAPESVLVPIAVGGETYLGHVGHAAFAWRIAPDYLVALYKPQGNRLAPVSGLYISKTRGKPSSATVE